MGSKPNRTFPAGSLSSALNYSAARQLYALAGGGAGEGIDRRQYITWYFPHFCFITYAAGPTAPEFPELEEEVELSSGKFLHLNKCLLLKMSLLVLQDINGTQCYDVTCQVPWIIQIFFCYSCFLLPQNLNLNPHSLLTGCDSCDICLHFHKLWLQQLMQLCYSLTLPLISRCNITPPVLRCNIQYSSSHYLLTPFPYQSFTKEQFYSGFRGSQTGWGCTVKHRSEKKNCNIQRVLGS